MQINEFILRDVRCFAGEQRLRTAPLTFLVGENSTGKSTALGCYHALAYMRRASFPHAPQIDFNIPPFEMGAFSNVARRGADSFSLGVQMEFPPTAQEIPPVVDCLCEFADDGRTYIRAIHYAAQGVTRCTVHYANGDNWRIQKITVNPEEGPLHEADESERAEFEEITHHIASGQPITAELHRRNPRVAEASQFITQHAAALKRLSYLVGMPPVRAKPKRVYEPIYSPADTEGNNMPLKLAELKLTQESRYQRIRAELNQFGKAAGLFSDIDIKFYSKGAGVPFSLMTKIRGVRASVADVGYGISQILPILVNMFADDNHATFLLQQPEVHLHPRPQAAFASLMVDAIAKKQQRFIVETHTDYMMDRARIEIRRGNIAPEDVAIAYFAPKNGNVTIHNIGFDQHGNMTNAPKEYGAFILRESNRFLGFEK